MLLRRPWVAGRGEVWCSRERKAIETAALIAKAGGTLPRQLTTLGENDRSATGYLPKAEFEATADAFFAAPNERIRGWETAANAQQRILAAVASILAASTTDCDIAIVFRGAVGALLLCHLKQRPITRTEDQPGASGGNYFCFEPTPYSLRHGWRTFEYTGP